MRGLRPIGLCVVVLLGVANATFLGGFGPRVTTGTGAGVIEPPPAVGGGLTSEEVASMLEHRRALVVAGEDVLVALEVARGLVDVGACVTLACKHPERAVEKVDAINEAASSRRRARTSGMVVEPSESGSAEEVGAAGDASSGDAARSSPSAAAASWQPSCRLRQLDLGTATDVYAFADELLREDEPLHVIVNCADDYSPLYRREGSGGAGGAGDEVVGDADDADEPPPVGWELVTGRNHLGPFLLTQLLLDQVVATMRADAAVAKEAARADGSARAVRKARAGWRGRRRAGEPAEDADSNADADADAASPPAPELRARPYPAPLGRVISLGLDARPARGQLPDPPALRGLFVRALNYTAWGSYRCSHEANTLAAIQLSRMLSVVRVPTPWAAEAGGLGECVEVNIVRPSRGRWLPRPLRRLVGAADGPALTATFLASTPIRGMSGLFFSDFESEPAWRKTASMPGGPGMAAQSFAARQLYAASMALTGSPAAQWRSEAAMTMRGFMAEQRRRMARLHRPSSAPDAGSRTQPQPLEADTLLGRAGADEPSVPPPPEAPPP